MTNEIKKSLYIALCGILGVAVLLVLERGLLLLGYLLRLDIESPGAQAADSLVVLLFVFLGLWYGVWLGLHWYRYVYESGEKRGFTEGLGAAEERIPAAKGWEIEDLVDTTARKKVPIRRPVRRRVTNT